MPQPVDLRSLAPPAPMLRILEALDAEPAGPLVFLVPLEPWPLYPLLAARRWRHRLDPAGDGWAITLYRDPPLP